MGERSLDSPVRLRCALELASKREPLPLRDSRDLWTPEIRNQIIAHNGSVQNIPEIPADLKALYRTSWEIKQRSLIDMAADRGAFIDQSQSFNVFVQDVSHASTEFSNPR